ncbi:MAG: glucuronate isomerase [Agarilytica sp.]
MKPFLNDDFLLSNDISCRLYHEVAKNLPIFDYHCHLDPKDIAKDRRFDNVAQLWFESDHYKWRAMRTLGVAERYISGDASDREKFDLWAKLMPQCVGSPLYHWTHMELKRPFGFTGLVFDSKTAEQVWQSTQESLKRPEFSARGILQQMNVQFIGTTDDPVDSLGHHKNIDQDENFNIEVRPTWRPDRALKIEEHGFCEYISQLSDSANIDISCYSDLLSALERRMQHFVALGCRGSDHSLERVRFESASEKEIEIIFQKALQFQSLSENEIAKYSTALYVWLAERYCENKWVMQLHIGAQRNNSSCHFATLGRDAGFDSISDGVFARPLAQLLDTMDANQNLPKTILYTLNPAANEMLATMAGNFQQVGVRGKTQFGSAWWFNDQKDGMQRQLEQVAQLGLLSVFVGMLTDSRSILSYVRHEYFRRILCDKVGRWVSEGEVPNDEHLLNALIKNVCFDNAKAFFAE